MCNGGNGYAYTCTSPSKETDYVEWKECITWLAFSDSHSSLNRLSLSIIHFFGRIAKPASFAQLIFVRDSSKILSKCKIRLRWKDSVTHFFTHTNTIVEFSIQFQYLLLLLFCPGEWRVYGYRSDRLHNIIRIKKLVVTNDGRLLMIS